MCYSLIGNKFRIVSTSLRVPECPDDAVANRAALGGEGGDRGQRPLAELASGWYAASAGTRRERCASLRDGLRPLPTEPGRESPVGGSYREKRGRRAPMVVPRNFVSRENQFQCRSSRFYPGRRQEQRR